jgi:rhodanese-related sulfurtransferase
VVVDIRPAKDFAAGHIVGAVNIPQDKLAARMASWKSTRPRPSFWSTPWASRRHPRSRAAQIRLHRRQAVRWRFQLESR